MLKQFRHKKFKTQNPTITNSGSGVAAVVGASDDTDKKVKVIKYGRKEWFKDRFKEVNAILILAFLWLLRITFVPSLLLVGATWFATNIIPSMAIQVFSTTSLSAESPLFDQFAFFYLPMIAFVFIFGLVVVVLVCYTEYKFWTKCGTWISYWFKRTGIVNPFKRNKKEVK